MDDVRKQILDLVNSTGKPASEITSRLANIGNGRMEDGISRIVDFVGKARFEAGTKAGTVRGIAGTTTALVAVGGIAYLIRLIRESIEKNKRNKALKEEGEAILKGLEAGMADSEDSTDNRGE